MLWREKAPLGGASLSSQKLALAQLTARALLMWPRSSVVSVPLRGSRFIRNGARLDRGNAGIAKTYGGTANAPDQTWLQNTALLVSIKGGSRHKITALGKAWNRAMVSPLRMQVEQNIGHLKNWRVLSGVHRAEFATHQNTIALVAGLHNFRILGSLNWEK